MKRGRVKFRNFLGDLPVHYAALFVNTTINNNYMTLLMALYHTHNGLFRCFKNNTHSWYTSNFESANKNPSFVRVAAFSRSYPPKKNWACLSGSPPQKNTNPPGCPFSNIPLKNCKLHLSWSLQHSTLNMCEYYFFFAEYKMVK